MLRPQLEAFMPSPVTTTTTPITTSFVNHVGDLQVTSTQSPTMASASSFSEDVAVALACAAEFELLIEDWGSVSSRDLEAELVLSVK
ncbi:Hypothetical predicted protein [Olea europaea subsp. europaea]|uniref:Uncharacterized protein n=1 Tax=Olea europaea subsp. europaea TaxID=158383 RepID=A0A8S0V2B9_OLEEU|nr:Hypothetical predicted protein [Olea europaea subsp. europaea]